MDERNTMKVVQDTEKSPEKFYIEKNAEFKRSVAKQVILGLLTNFSSIAPSMSLGFSAVTIPVLTSVTNPYALNSDQASWFASIASLATPFGCLISGPISDRWGRRTGIIFINIICFIGWLTIASSYYLQDHQYPILLIGRLFTGFSTGLSSVPATIYMAEISTPKLRAVFCTWASISFAVGVLVVYFLGYLLQNDWGTISLITCVFPCIGFVFVLFLIPESPNWLIRKDRIEEAKVNICKIWGVKDYIPEIQQEVDNLLKTKTVKSGAKQKNIFQQSVKKFKHLMKISCLKPLGLIITFFFFQQFSGTFVIVFYAINIVRDAGVELDPYLTIVLIGLIRMLSSMLASYICKIYGRRPLSLISGAGMTLTMTILACYILLIIQGKVSKSAQDSLSFLPVVLLLLYFFVSTIGFLPIPFAMAAEVFPSKLRGTATGLASGCGYFFNFITVKIYPSMVDNLGRPGVFFFYGALSLVGTVFVFFLLPETKGKSLQEIEEFFQKKRVKRNSLLQEKCPV